MFQSRLLYVTRATQQPAQQVGDETNMEHPVPETLGELGELLCSAMSCSYDNLSLMHIAA
jgi:hypothetical protein